MRTNEIKTNCKEEQNENRWKWSKSKRKWSMQNLKNKNKIEKKYGVQMRAWASFNSQKWKMQ